MIKKKILILKNDRAGDLFTSLKLISSLINDKTFIKIYLSELNIGFSFFFKSIKVSKLNYKLKILDKVKVFFDILKNQYDEIFILSPKGFYFILPFIFRKVKFYAIVYDGKKRLRPSLFLRKFLYKYKIISRNKINLKSYRDLQLELLNNDHNIDHKFLNLNIPNIDINLKKLLPESFLLFQFRYKFFEDLNWGIPEFDKIMQSILKKYKFVLFCSDIEKNPSSKKFNNYFENNFSIIDSKICKKFIKSKNNIIYLKDVNSENLFSIVKLSDKTLAKEGIISHISFFHSIDCHNLFNFKIENLNDYHHQKISYSEWCKGMNFKFSFLNSDVDKAIKKISKNI